MSDRDKDSPDATVSGMSFYGVNRESGSYEWRASPVTEQDLHEAIESYLARQAQLDAMSSQERLAQFPIIMSPQDYKLCVEYAEEHGVNPVTGERIR